MRPTRKAHRGGIGVWCEVRRGPWIGVAVAAVPSVPAPLAARSRSPQPQPAARGWPVRTKARPGMTKNACQRRPIAALSCVWAKNRPERKKAPSIARRCHAFWSRQGALPCVSVAAAGAAAANRTNSHTPAADGPRGNSSGCQPDKLPHPGGGWTAREFVRTTNDDFARTARIAELFPRPIPPCQCQQRPVAAAGPGFTEQPRPAAPPRATPESPRPDQSPAQIPWSEASPPRATTHSPRCT